METVRVSGSGPTCSVLMCLSPTDQRELQDGGRTPREEGGREGGGSSTFSHTGRIPPPPPLLLPL